MTEVYGIRGIGSRYYLAHAMGGNERPRLRTGSTRSAGGPVTVLGG
ncbi:hypothetical protein [Streptomyces eurythermus]